jgi:hypothetical protein
MKAVEGVLSFDVFIATSPVDYVTSSVVFYFLYD